jgi:hypothetical protein
MRPHRALFLFLISISAFLIAAAALHSTPRKTNAIQLWLTN